MFILGHSFSPFFILKKNAINLFSDWKECEDGEGERMKNVIFQLLLLLFGPEFAVFGGKNIAILGDPEATANLYCNSPYPYWEGCVICSIYLR